MRTKRMAVEDAVVRERVGMGTAETTYRVPISRPAQVVERQSDPDTLRAYSDVQQDQWKKVTGGSAIYFATAAGIYALLAGTSALFSFSFSPLLSLALAATGIVSMALIATVAWNSARQPGFSASDLVVAIAIVAAALIVLGYASGYEHEIALCTLATLLAMLNPYASPALVSGLKSLNLMPKLDEVLYQHHEEMTVTQDSPVVPRGSMMPSEVLMKAANDDGTPLFGSAPYFLYAQIEDFCQLAMVERYGADKKPVSGLSRASMVGEEIGPPNGTVPGREVSRIKVSAGMWQIIVEGLVAVGLAQRTPAGTVWSKIAPNSTYTSGYSLGEIRTILMNHTIQASMLQEKKK